MTVYNARAYVANAIDSILEQTFRDWELILLDDGSTDGSQEVLSSRRGPRVRITVLSSNIGRTPALRLAFDQARGEYVAVLDADDVSRADRLARQVAYLDAHPEVVLVGSWARYIDEAGRPTGWWHPPADRGALYGLLAWGNPIVHSSATYRRSAAVEAGGYPLSLPYAQDCGLWLRLASRGALAIIPEELCDQRIVDASMTRGDRFRTDIARDGLYLARAARRVLKPRGMAARWNRDAITIARIKCAIAAHHRGETLTAAGGVILAVLRDPAVLVRGRQYRRAHTQGPMDRERSGA